MTGIPKNNELDNMSKIRYQIVKSMLAEFPKLRIKITNTLLIEPPHSLGTKERSILGEYLENIGKKSENYHKEKSKKVIQKNHYKETLDEITPLWVKLARASVKYNRDGKYYVFK